MMLALGDALAITLMEAKGFNNKDYGIFHPGGKLGAEFIKVKDLMRTGANIPTVASHAFLPKTLFEMTSKHLGCTAVVDKSGLLVGIITDGDLRRHISKNFMKLTAKDLMTTNPIIITPDMLAIEAVALMNQKNITNLFVVKNPNVQEKELEGILHIHDCLKAGVV
jgi:arabinose-5-phosphate isomerase